MQWLQDPNQSTEDNLYNLRREATRHFMKKKMEYLKATNDELDSKCKIKNSRDLQKDINDFKKGYQPKINIVRDERDDLVTDSYSFLARWRKYFSHLLKVHGVDDVRKT